ncbi:Helix-turn-helix domain protein [compost metagenome]
MSRAYIDDDDRAYVAAIKKHLASVIKRRGLTLDDLSDATGIPEPSLRRWLSTRNHSFMPLHAARRICQALGIEIADMLMPVGQRGGDRVLLAFLNLPPALAELAVRYAYDVAAACGKPIPVDPDK